jgi:hypothetical protein
MSIHAASVERSARLQATLRAVSRRGGATTAEIAAATKSCAVHTDVSELRARGWRVRCWCLGMQGGRRIYKYELGKRL